MKHRRTLLNLAVASVVALGLGLTVGTAQAAKKGYEKCYGVVKKGMNDCGVSGGHSCAGKAAVDGDSTEWVYLPEGSCDKVVNGSLTPGKENMDHS